MQSMGLTNFGRRVDLLAQIASGVSGVAETFARSRKRVQDNAQLDGEKAGSTIADKSNRREHYEGNLRMKTP